jgi:pimeloyl-ACP methyl ester carboxylesterase
LLTALVGLLAAFVPLGVGGLASACSKHGHGPRPTIVLVHGDWSDGSSWRGVVKRLQNRGFTVAAPPTPLRGPSFNGDSHVINEDKPLEAGSPWLGFYGVTAPVSNVVRVTVEVPPASTSG